MARLFDAFLPVASRWHHHRGLRHLPWFKHEPRGFAGDAYARMDVDVCLVQFLDLGVYRLAVPGGRCTADVNDAVGDPTAPAVYRCFYWGGLDWVGYTCTEGLNLTWNVSAIIYACTTLIIIVCNVPRPRIFRKNYPTIISCVSIWTLDSRMRVSQLGLITSVFLQRKWWLCIGRIKIKVSIAAIGAA